MSVSEGPSTTVALLGACLAAGHAGCLAITWQLGSPPVLEREHRAPRERHDVVIMIVGSRGDVQPFVALARGLAALRGWLVTIRTARRTQTSPYLSPSFEGQERHARGQRRRNGSSHSCPRQSESHRWPYLRQGPR